MSHRYLNPPSDEVYYSVMQKRGLQPEVVQLAHNTEGYWLGNKNAKNVVVYYHGMYPTLYTSTPPACVTLSERSIDLRQKTL